MPMKVISDIEKQNMKKKKKKKEKQVNLGESNDYNIAKLTIYLNI